MSPALIFVAWQKARLQFTGTVSAEFQRIRFGGRYPRQQRERQQRLIKRLGERERRLYAAYVRKTEALGLSGPARLLGPRAVAR
ncbi:MAG TPA: hypothetical protein VK510_03195 [Solirubrobacteraceae bacterium]|nr:hypothetical protein [Solirubrobacteraceae bacterium]